jgi:hypothetical protein
MRNKALLLSVGGALVLGAVVYGGVSNADDTFIYMRYVDNALSGHGYVFNVGERSYGFTSAVWTLLMTPVAAVFGNSIETWKIASWCCYALLVGAVLVLAARSEGRYAVPLAAAVVLEPHLVRWSGTGMENALAAIAVLGVLLAWQQLLKRDRGHLWFGAMAGTLPLVRPELALLGGILMLEWLIRSHRERRYAPFISGAAVAVVVGLIGAAIMYQLTGFVVPQTGMAKALAAEQTRSFYAVRQASMIVASGGVAFFVAAFLLLRDPDARKLVRGPLLFVGVSLLYLGWQNHLVSSRYSVSIVGPVMIAVFLAMRDARYQRLRLMLAGTQLAGAAVVLVILFPQTRTDEGLAIRQFELLTRPYLAPGARVAMTEVGAFAFYSRAPVIDLVGLTDPETVKWLKVNGKAHTLPALEALLDSRGATHWVDGFASFVPAGTRFEFVSLVEAPVSRNNRSAVRSTWRLYRLVPRPPRPAAD